MMKLEELREKIRKRFFERGWDNDSIISPVNGWKEKKLQEFYERILVIHPPFFYNFSIGNKLKGLNRKDFIWKHDLEKAWNKNPRRYDKYILEIITDLIIEYIKDPEFKSHDKELFITFNHYGKDVVNCRDYWVDINGKIRIVK